jgi:O-antigen biosynthesis protein
VTRLAVPCTEHPEVSVVMVTFNAWSWTARALAALVEHTDPGYELIVVDNASTDGTLDGLAALQGATVLRNPVNRGFGPAANQAALRARAPHLLLLNTDSLVHPGWLPPLRAILDGEPDVAAVAPRLLHLDGTVQESGSILWGDAEVWAYGALQPPERPEYRFRRDVDHASAACLLLRRSAFVDAGGFDPVYAPAYYEDVDLCLRFWERGLRTVCQPRSEVTHASGASTDRERIGALLARNRPIFQERWARLLSRRPPSPVHWEPEDVLPGRDLRCSDRVLVVGDLVPDARQPRLRELLLTLVRLWPRGRITHLALDGLGAEESAPPLLAAGVEVAWPGDAAGTWLAQRRHHYEVVIGTSWAAVMPPVRRLLEATQSPAQHALLLDRAFEHDIADAGYLEAVRASRLLLCEDEAQRTLASRLVPAAETAVFAPGESPAASDRALAGALAPLGMTPSIRPGAIRRP